MNKNHALIFLVIILLAAFFLRQHKLMDFPYFGDEVDNGDIALGILHGKIAPFYPNADGQEALYYYPMAVSFAVLGDSVIANRWPSVAWSMVFVALMYVYGCTLFKSRRVGVMAAGLTAALWWPAVFAHVGLRAVTLPVICAPALMGLDEALRTTSEQRAMKAGVIGGMFAGLAAYTYSSGRGFPIIVVLFLAYAALAHRERLFKRWRVFLVYLVLTVVVSAWLYIYLRLHPDYDARPALMQQGLGMLAKGDFKGLLPAVRDTLAMFTVKGESVWLYNVTGRPVFVGPEGWLFYLGVLVCLWRLRKPEYALQLIVLATMLMPSILTEHPPSWTRSIGILPALIVTTVLPIEWVWSRLEGKTLKPISLSPSRIRRVALPLYAALVVALGISVYGRTAFDMLQVWMNHPGVYWMTLAHYSETADYINHSPDSTPLNFTMDAAIPWRKTNVQRAIQRKNVALRYTLDHALIFPDDPRGLRVAFQRLAPPALALQQAFFDLNAPIYTGPRMDPTGQRPLRVYYIPRARLDERLARARQSAVYIPYTNTLVPSAVTVGDLLEFLGYEIVNPDAQPGSKLMMLTYWRVLHRPPDETTMFLHLIDQDRKLVAQFDGMGTVMDDLVPGDMIVQLHTLKLPQELPNAVYCFQLGMYRLDTLERFPLNIDVPDRMVWLQTWQPKEKN
jgi:hypothetical protein